MSEPAFPGVIDIERFEESLGKYVPHLVPMGGMSKRELIAMGALNGMMSGCPWSADQLQDPSIRPTLANVADISVMAADALIERLKK